MKIAYVGNFEPDHSTETHLAASLVALGHDVRPIQEGRVPTRAVPAAVEGADLVLWTQTYSLAQQGGSRADRFGMVQAIQNAGIPIVSVHLDRWWGLAREHQVHEEAFFRTDLVATADGGHAAEWAAAGIEHVWFPPGVYHAEAHDGTPRDEFRSDVAFVGSWDRYGHEEWRPYRDELIARLRGWYGDRFRCWPPKGQHAVRGQALNDLYASVKVVVGDSCLVPNADGTPCRAYVSDRIFETLGRGGFFLHPRVASVTDGTLVTAGIDLGGWWLGEWDSLHYEIEQYRGDRHLREYVRHAGAAHVRERHTYRDRMRDLLRQIEERGLLRREVAWD